MVKKDCLYYEETNDMGATVNWCKSDREIIDTCSWCDEYVHKDLVPVVRCKDCKYAEHWYGDKAMCFLWSENGIDVFEDGYCNYGERRKTMSKWIPITARPMDTEERLERSEELGFDIEYNEALIYTSELPDDGQEVLVCGRYGRVWIDTFENDPDYGCGFEENGDMDGIVAWMPLPSPYRGERREDGCTD